MPHHLLVLDAETFYDKDYTLKQMTPAEYILDARFESIMWAAKADNGPHQIIDGSDFPDWLAQYPPEQTTTVTFNALFDNAILAWRYGYVPHTMIDAMAMARTIDGHKLARFSLATVSNHIGIPPKGDAIHNVIGMHRADIKANPALWQSFSDYALRDNMNCEAIFKHYYPQFPTSERRLMDMVLRCCVQPRFVVDIALLEKHLDDVVADKERILAAATLLTNGRAGKSAILSSKKFEEELKALGVEIKYKTTAAGNLAPAFAKTDEFMEELKEHPDPAVAALAAARVGLKSTLEETRARRLLAIGRLPWAVTDTGHPRIYSGGTMPIPLRYGGAHTHRLSGDWRMNMQNMPTVRGSKGKSKLRLSLCAPPGHTVLTIDLGQIEARLVAWLCREALLLTEFARYDAGDKKFDPYNRLASAVFGRDVNRKLVGTVDEVMGFIGKTGILGLGYGCGRDKFDSMVVRSARAMGVDISQIYTREVGDRAWATYRGRYPSIPRGWYHLDNLVKHVWCTPASQPVRFGPVEISYAKVMLPSGLPMNYDDPRVPMGDQNSFTYGFGGIRHTMYGAKMLENISQALGRVIVMNAALRIRDRGKHTRYPWAYFFVHQAHDELVYIIPDDELDMAKKVIHEEMTRPPSWGRDIPLTADIGTGRSYGEAK